MKKGFALIEVIVTLLIGSIITLSLYNIYIRIQRSVFDVQEVIDSNIAIPSMYNQLERDVLGIFVPAMPKQESDSKNLKQIKNIFFAEKKDNIFLLSFLTTGGFHPVDSKGVPLALPYIYRVTYTFEKDEKDPQVFLLKRSQIEDNGRNLDFDSSKDTHQGAGYVIGDKFKKIDISFQIFKKSKDKENKIEKITDFKADEIFKKFGSYIPAYIEVSGIYVYPNSKREIPFSYKFMIPAYNLSEQKTEEKTPEKLQEKK